jgi:hypothetical protein
MLIVSGAFALQLKWERGLTRFAPKWSLGVTEVIVNYKHFDPPGLEIKNGLSQQCAAQDDRGHAEIYDYPGHVHKRRDEGG